LTGKVYTTNGGELEIGEDNSASCVKTLQTIFVDGQALKLSVYNIGGNNYFRLVDLGTQLGFDVTYLAESNTAQITTK
ncbi:MAG: hypothetical protein PHP26_11310, partial [Syntrophomonas sp.]|nr:hypothetical protein [Syntrophomonas sp.]